MTNEEIELALHDRARQQRCAARYEWIRLHFDAAQLLLACHLDDPKSLDGAIDQKIQQESHEAQLPREG